MGNDNVNVSPYLRLPLRSYAKVIRERECKVRRAGPGREAEASRERPNNACQDE